MASQPALLAASRPTLESSKINTSETDKEKCSNAKINASGTQN